jgi:hypothetical protein
MAHVLAAADCEHASENGGISGGLTPQAVLADLFDSDDFPDEIADPEKAGETVVQRLPGCRAGRPELQAEIDRLQDATRRALALADERRVLKKA